MAQEINWPALIAGALAATSLGGNALQGQEASRAGIEKDAYEMVLETMTKGVNRLMEKQDKLEAELKECKSRHD